MCNFLCHVLGLSGFEPGRISDNFMKRFDSPSVNDEVPVFRPKKKLLSFDQVMRRVSANMNIFKNTLDSISCQLQSFQTPSSSDDVRQQRDLELDEVRNARWKNITPRTKELSRGNQRLTTKPFRKSWCPPDESELSFNKVDHFYIWASLYFECF